MVGAIALAVSGIHVVSPALAQDSFTDIRPGQAVVDFVFGGTQITIQRSKAPTGQELLPQEGCPGYCIEPGIAAPGVVTLTELDILDFLQSRVAEGDGLLVDARLPDAYRAASIPGAISVPSATLVAGNPYREDLLLALGATGALGNMNFSNAFDLVVFDEGPWSPTARSAVARLLEVGYPAQKLFYYRGGLQAWQALGLSVSK